MILNKLIQYNHFPIKSTLPTIDPNLITKTSFLNAKFIYRLVITLNVEKEYIALLYENLLRY